MKLDYLKLHNKKVNKIKQKPYGIYSQQIMP